LKFVVSISSTTILSVWSKLFSTVVCRHTQPLLYLMYSYLEYHIDCQFRHHVEVLLEIMAGKSAGESFGGRKNDKRYGGKKADRLGWFLLVHLLTAFATMTIIVVM
jgi:hypothetical protein